MKYFLKKLIKNNKKFNLNIINISKNIKLFEKYLGNNGYKELQELFSYYNSKIRSDFFLDLNFHKKTIKQMENNICRIFNFNNGGYGNGFFCKIPFPNKDNMLTVLITQISLINEDYKYLVINNRNNYTKNIFFEARRIKYISKEYGRAIIEIRPDYDDIYIFLELEDKILNNIVYSENNEYKYNGVYQLLYIERELLISYGVLYDLDEKAKFMFYDNVVHHESLGSPILNLNNKVIGECVLYKYRRDGFSDGCFLNYPIKEFIQKNYNL